MTQTTIKAAQNPDLVNSMVADVLAEPVKAPEPVSILLPSDTVVTLPGGYLNAAGEVIRQVEVRELTGRDEEAISRTTSMGKALLTILNRGTVKIGDEKATDEMLDKMLAGDRDTVLLGIYKATFGPTSKVFAICGTCEVHKEVTVEIDNDIKIKPMVDENMRRFTVDCKVGEVEVALPNGHTQKALINNADKTVSELTTILLEECVLKINGSPVLSKFQVQSLGIQDRQKIAEALNKNNIGPQFDDLKVTCPDCEGEVIVPINMGGLFRF